MPTFKGLKGSMKIVTVVIEMDNNITTTLKIILLLKYYLSILQNFAFLFFLELLILQTKNISKTNNK